VQFDVDFHIHGKYSGGVSDEMLIPVIGKQAELKGLHLVGTGDATNPRWLAHIKESVGDETGGVYSLHGSKTRFLVTAEVEDARRVHHLVLLPSLAAAEQLYELLKRFSNDIDADGRPHLRINGEELLDYTKSVGALVGPAHAFTPWTAIFKEYDSIKECYGKNWKDIRFLELGLSADTDMADRIPELRDLTFVSNSDTHSPWPHRLGREFNRIRIEDLSFKEIKWAFENRDGRGFVLNVGLNPREGKYHLSGCSRCFQRFRLPDAVRLNWRCPECRGLIKKGVVDRIEELASSKTPVHPAHRPPYMHIVPLAEVISLVLGISTLTSIKIKARWDTLVSRFGTEINVLVDAGIDDVKKADPEVGAVIERFRSGRMKYVGGGGGQYGRPTLKNESDVFYGVGQKTLSDF